ncbi:MAG: hypothetical protein ACK5N8_01870 [Alphaproteobacteria bacterium]
MIRVWIVLFALFFVFYKIYRLNKKILLAKSFIFITEIKKGTLPHEAVYKANLFDFMTKKEANDVLHSAEIEIFQDYENKPKDLIYRANSWGFVDTHTKAAFKKRNRARKLLEQIFITQEVGTFTGNAAKIAKESVFKYWDENAVLLINLHERVCLLKILLERYKDLKEPFCMSVATQIGAELSKDAEYLDKEDIEIIQEWDNLVKNKISKKK